MFNYRENVLTYLVSIKWKGSNQSRKFRAQACHCRSLGCDGFGEEYKLGCTLAEELRFEQVKKEGIGTQRVVSRRGKDT